MIIECPDCATRYEIKAELPPDGRTVRCAKCGTVWRAMPDSGGEEAETSASAWVAPSGESEETNDAPAEQTTRDHFGTTGGDFEEGLWSSHQDAAAIHKEAVAGEETPLNNGREAHREWRADESEANENTGKVSWFSSFRRKKNLKPTDEADENAANTLTQPTAETIPFPRTNFSVTQQETKTKEEQHTINSARQAVRSVFSNLGHGGPVATAAMSEDDDERAVIEPAKPHPQNGWSERLAGLSDHFKKAGETGGDHSLAEADGKRSGRDLDTVEDDAWFAEKKDDASSDSDPDDALREAMRAHFLSPSKRTSVGPSLRDEELAEKLETHLKSTAVTASEEHPRPRGIAGLWGKVSPAAEEEAYEPMPAVVEEPVEVKDDDTAFDQRLYREIEETREKLSEAPRRSQRGGLAVVAAWGLFLCVASGLIVGFFAFRDIIADAAPGLAPLYRILGMPVTVQPLVFESVEYEWSTSDNRPVLTVRGNVFNRANRNVRVPQFFITVKDQDSAQDREYSANLRINGSKIRSNERADFDIELVSPNPTVTAVELELRNVR